MPCVRENEVSGGGMTTYQTICRQSMRQKPLTEQQERTAAREQLIKSNMRFVSQVAKKYTSSGVPLEDLTQSGMIGLCIAADKFDPRRGFKFITYAVWWIRREILMYISRASRCVYVSLSANSALNNGGKGIDATLDELQMSYLQTKPLALSASVGNRDDLVQDCIPGYDPRDEEMRWDLGRQMHKVLTRLNKRDREMLCAKYGIGRDGVELCAEEIARRHGITVTRVNGLLQRARRILAEYPTMKELRTA